MSDPAARLEYLRESRAEGCHRCPLYRNRGRLVFGDGNPDADIVLVGEAPGRDENVAGVPFIGPAGKVLDGLLRRVGLSRGPDGPLYICNVVKCWPGHGNPNPEPGQIEACLPFLRVQLRIVRPKVVIALGGVAGTTLTGNPLGESVGYMRNHDWTYEDAVTGVRAPVVVTYHPSYILRNLSDDRKTAKEAALKVQADLRKAIRLVHPDR